MTISVESLYFQITTFKSKLYYIYDKNIFFLIQFKIEGVYICQLIENDYSMRFLTIF